MIKSQFKIGEKIEIYILLHPPVCLTSTPWKWPSFTRTITHTNTHASLVRSLTFNNSLNPYKLPLVNMSKSNFLILSPHMNWFVRLGQIEKYSLTLTSVVTKRRHLQQCVAFTHKPLLRMSHMYDLITAHRRKYVCFVWSIFV